MQEFEPKSITPFTGTLMDAIRLNLEKEAEERSLRMTEQVHGSKRNASLWSASPARSTNELGAVAIIDNALRMLQDDSNFPQNDVSYRSHLRQ